MKAVARILGVLGVLLAAYAVVGRFLGDRTVFGWLLQGGMAAQSAMIGANTLLLLAVLAYQCGPCGRTETKPPA